MVNSISEQIEKIKEAFKEDVKANSDLQALKVKYLGRKEGLLTLLFEKFKNFTVEEKRQFGPGLQRLRSEVETELKNLEDAHTGASSEVDLTLPSEKVEYGHLHPITKLQKEIEKVFIGLGFDVELGPEIESDFFNFEALNIPEDHPARDMQDTFYLDIEKPKEEKGKKILLRTHTSPMQVRYMQAHKPPFSIIIPGRVYRNEALDASHEHTFQQMEGLVVGKNINFAQMTWTLDYAMKEIFGSDVKTKLLPAFFPFVEPGAELAISCLVCKGKGCSVCKQTGWVELLGCGMVHQKVFKAAGYKENEYTGFAFGFGLSRFALMKYDIPDIRMFSENDLRFLKQF